MCQSKVFLIKEGKEEKLLDDAVLVEPLDDGVKVQGMFQQPKVLKARIKTIDLMKHKIILEEYGK